MQISGHILIIDDEASLRRTLARILQQASFEVTTAASGQEGLAFLSQQSFDLVYLDIRMPDMNGFEATASQRGAGRPTGGRSGSQETCP